MYIVIRNNIINTQRAPNPEERGSERVERLNRVQYVRTRVVYPTESFRRRFRGFKRLL